MLYAPASIITPHPVILKKETALAMLVKSALLILFGTLVLSGISPVIRAGSLIAIVAIFFFTLRTRNYFSFLMQLFICSHFVFNNQLGGLFNMAAILALLVMMMFNPMNIQLSRSSLTPYIKTVLFALFCIQVISIAGGNQFGLLPRIMGIAVFFTLLFLFYFASKVQITAADYRSLLTILLMMCIYMLLVSLNQKYILIPYNLPFIPLYDQNAQFDFEITRGSGTFLNFEAYAEYSLSVICLLLPAVLSGSVRKLGRHAFITALIAILFSMVAIVLSGTRSSILLLFVLFFLVVFFGRKIRRSTILVFLLLLTAGYTVNRVYQFVDLDVFRKRSQDIDLNNLSLAKLMKGEEINREETFFLAKKQLAKSPGIIGGGYFPSMDEYRGVHFGAGGSDYLDFHNLYLSAAVIWGYAGAFLFISLFGFTLFNGIKTYNRSPRAPVLYKDLLLGFNFLFLLFLVNQLKIQFIRDVNYFMLMLILTAVYCTLIREVGKGSRRSAVSSQQSEHLILLNSRNKNQSTKYSRICHGKNADR